MKHQRMDFIRTCAIALLLIWAKAPGISQQNYMATSVEMLENLRSGASVDGQLAAFASSTHEDILSEIDTDPERLAFWVNVYNAHIQYVLAKDPELYDDRRTFFKEPRVKIAGRVLSFEEIEHGIIRHSALPWGLGIIGKIFPPRWERDLRVEDKDWRIHFALNCGAKDCPPVAIYHADRVSEEFDFMTTKFLQETTAYSKDTETAEVVALFNWFRGDFGCKRGVKQILEDYSITPERPQKIDYRSYDWTLDLGNYRDIPAE